MRGASPTSAVMAGLVPATQTRRCAKWNRGGDTAHCSALPAFLGGRSFRVVPVSLPACGLPVTSVEPLFTWIDHLSAVAVPPLSLTTCLMTVSDPTRRLFKYVHVQFSPSFMLMVTVVVLVVYEPPLGVVTVQDTESKPQPAGIVLSLTV